MTDVRGGRGAYVVTDSSTGCPRQEDGDWVLTGWSCF